ncbi:cystathionine beta-lyase [Zavarzinia sp.]|uniref:cystathionine beta-lyase n=1 Tax=Zavarzinia sp. TaxID=2027920 RepID=UPI0035654ED5
MSRKARPDTEIVHAGRRPFDHQGAVNPPVYHVSTILFPTLDAIEAAHRPSDDPRRVTYGRRGTPTSFAFAEAMAALEGGAGCVITPSGLSACTTALLGLAKAGDHVLMVDTCYGPTRNFCDGVLTRLGVETSYYDPLVGAGIAALIRPNTSVIFLESPGSLTFEVQDVPAIVAAAKAADHEIVTAIDNTWAAGHFFKPLSLGVDVSIQAATKYIVGHSDALIGTIVANQKIFPRLQRTAGDLGLWTGPDDMYLAQRGLRTLAVRLERHQETGLALARYLQARPEVARVLHPGLPGDPSHALWKRDFTGASGLFGALLHPVSHDALAAFLDGLEFFGMGWSWGGYESLCIPQHPESLRSATRWTEPGPLLRFHAGLEDPADLIADLEAGFARMAGG